MTNNTPPKHQTPNYRLVTHTRNITDAFGRKRLVSWCSWDAMPLRAGRKDV